MNSREALPINETEAMRIVDAIPPGPVHELVLLGLAEARQRYARPKSIAEAAWRPNLPAAPFDMAFYASVLVAMFEKTRLIRAVLDGSKLDDAAGWPEDA